MNPRDSSQVSRLYHAALERPPEERPAFLAGACAGDDELRVEIESLLAKADARQPGTGFPQTTRFELRRRLGQGGFGTVYEALDRQRGVSVALKVLHATNPAALYSFKREFRTLADLTHHNLIALDELFSEADCWFFTMELIHGYSIVDFIRHAPAVPLVAARPMTEVETTAGAGPGGVAPLAVTAPGLVDEARLRDAFGQLVEGLQTIHQHGIVHRDIKPSNVLATADGRVVILDFGIATRFAPDAASVTSVAGTPAYMAPEQALGNPASPASDWYSVGVMLYEAVTGRLPFSGTAYEMILAKQHVPRLPGDVPASEVLALSLALLNPDPSQRPAGAEVLRRIKVEPTVSRETPVAAATSAPGLIGRETHLRALTAAFDTASAGRSVVVFMPGASGVGKSALVRRFLADLRQRTDAPVTIAGRCHERELVPYKAVDGLVDGLARYLERLPAIEVARQLPRDVSLLARLFPVLLRVTEVDLAQRRVTIPRDPMELRRRAAAALRELLARLSDRAPLVLAVDDGQWGDLDSASLLQEILRPPDPPPLLLLMAYRAEANLAPFVRALRDSLRGDAEGRDVRTLQVDELTHEQAYELACRELAGRGEMSPERCADIARESRGNSFFVHELVHHTVTVGGPARLDTVVRDRVSALPANAQHLMTVIALSAQPVTASLAALAAGIDGDPHDALRLLRGGHLVRIHESGQVQELESYHDRIRETLIAGLDAATSSRWHARLAAAWEASGHARPETLVTHFRGAGDLVHTAQYAVRAAEAAEQALAFRRAAQYYRLLIEVDEPVRRSAWQTRLGDALAHAGLGRDAAAAYHQALHDTGPGLPEPLVAGMAIELERRAAEQLIRAGYLNQAATVLDSLLPRIGVRPPRTEAGAFAGLVTRRLALAVRGTGFRERKESDIPLEDLRRIDVLWSIGAPLSLVDLVRGNHLHLLGTHLVLRAGEPKRVVRAISTLACAAAIAGSHRDSRTVRILEQAKALATRLGDPTSVAHTLLAEAICDKVVGRWVRARERLERAIDALMPCPGVRWEIETARTLLHDTLFWMGEWKQLFNEIPARRQQAEECGDLYSATHVAVRLSAIAHLASDEPDRARVEAMAGMARWPSGHFDLQHRWEVCSLVEADLYAGRAADAWTRLRAAWPRLRWTLQAFQNARIEMRFFRARIALARAADGETAFLRDAARDADRLERENAVWASALARLVRASAAATRGDIDAAVPQLAAADRALRDAGMLHYAAAAEYRRGQLLGGDEGGALLTRAITFFTEQRVLNPERITNLLAPGRWTSH